MHILFILLISLAACTNKQNKTMTANAEGTSQADTLRQGIAGKVLWVEGNMMPTFGQDSADRQEKPISREIYIYALTGEEQAQMRNGFYIDIETPLIEKTHSDEGGNFSVSLPPGQYSILTKEPEGLYANTYDGAGNIQPVTVIKDSVSHITLIIDYKAVY